MRMVRYCSPTPEIVTDRWMGLEDARWCVALECGRGHQLQMAVTSSRHPSWKLASCCTKPLAEFCTRPGPLYGAGRRAWPTPKHRLEDVFRACEPHLKRILNDYSIRAAGALPGNATQR